MMAMEANFDGLIGPTHNYGGLSDGNLASAKNAGLVASPRAAALQGLEKMNAMRAAGLWQGVFPPHQRPHLPTLRRMGFSGTDTQIYEAVWHSEPVLAKNILSASSMWSANAATISPSADCANGVIHMTPANLSTMLHRSIEHEQTERALKRAFGFAKVHPALPEHAIFSDEGAANHVRLCEARHKKGVEIFVFGRDGYVPQKVGFPARQTLQACHAIARSHQLSPRRTVFALQSNAAIDAGAFHNDVACVGALDTLFYHELAFENKRSVQADILNAAEGLFDPKFVEVPNSEVPIGDAISAYLFNSMLVLFPGADRLTLVAPLEAQETDSTRIYCEKLVKGNGRIGAVKYVDVRQSMRNGGGPACLRLRVTLTDQEWAMVNPAMKLSDSLYHQLREWVMKHYREALAPKDLLDPALMTESFAALDELTNIMNLGSDFYPFQRTSL